MRPFLFLLMFLLSWLMNSFAESPVIAKRDCQTSCGEVPIPFPFGIGASCYLHDLYEVNCSSNSKPILRSIDLEILNISSKESTMVVNHPVALFCSDENLTEVSSGSLENTPFFFSSAKNKFTGFGCNALIYMSSNVSIISGCMSVCDKKNISVDTMGCYAIKCCQTSIPSSLHLQVFYAGLSTFNYEGGTQDKCNSAFLVDQQWFESKVSSPKEVRGRKHVPVVLDWGIPDSLFDPLKRNSSQIYETTSDCTISTNMTNTSTSTNSTNKMSNGTLVPVLQCNCKSGYEGNPYLLQGCQDIDECQLRHQFCGPEMICVNTYGGFRCFPNRTIKSTTPMILLGIGIGIGALFLLIGARWLNNIQKRRKNIKLKEDYFSLLLQQQLTSLDGNVDRSKLFKSKELDAATNHFNTDRILGQGGQGTVYKGMLLDGKIVAVKKSKVVDEAKIEEFINEVAILSQINHRNVVKLLGCCLETEVPLLVYEFIPNGTLFQYLHNQVEELPLTWDMRLQIATEVAGALYYLHSVASLPIYHRDIKSANILLDDKYRAKVADFGTSRSIAIDQTHVTTKVQGTFGYLDPEYFQTSQFTDKSDVYSFGVVIVELLTGQKPISSTRSEDYTSLAAHFLLSMAENNLFNILDPEVKQISKKEEVMIVANLAKRCLNQSGKKRPTMKEVAMVLEAIRASQNESNVQQNFEEVECVTTEVVKPWDVVFTSTSSTFEIAAPLTEVNRLLTK